MKTGILMSGHLSAVSRWLPIAALLYLVPAVEAQAEDPIINCTAIDIDFADSGATKECHKADLSSGTWVGFRQSLIAKGPGYVLFFVRVKAGHNSYMLSEEATSIAKSLGQSMLGSAPVVSSHTPVTSFDIATFSGSPAGSAQNQVTCFAFYRAQGMVVSRGGFNGPPGYSASYAGAYCAAKPGADSDDQIAQILGKLRLPSD